MCLLSHRQYRACIQIVCDRESGKPRGFGFVTFSSPRAAQAAIRAMDGEVSDSSSHDIGNLNHKIAAAVSQTKVINGGLLSAEVWHV